MISNKSSSGGSDFAVAIHDNFHTIMFVTDAAVSLDRIVVSIALLKKVQIYPVKSPSLTIK